MIRQYDHEVQAGAVVRPLMGPNHGPSDAAVLAPVLGSRRGLVLANGIRIASLARDRFGTLLALGVTAMFAVHVFVNIGMTIGLVPITGIPLPFLSYGGSFLLSCCILQGLVQSVYRFRKEF